jgi:hypothetical protein
MSVVEEHEEERSDSEPFPHYLTASLPLPLPLPLFFVLVLVLVLVLVANMEQAQTYHPYEKILESSSEWITDPATDRLIRTNQWVVCYANT